MQKGNVLLIGNSGVGKSTLVNAVLGEDTAVTGFGTEGTTRRLSVYENPELSFRLMDTAGFEPSLFRRMQAIRAVKKWSKESAKSGRENTQIHVIWFCVDGTSSKLFEKTMRSFARAIAMWPSVPILVVITKSYSLPDRARNIRMIENALLTNHRYGKNIKGIFPVVATPYVIREDTVVAPEGIAELIARTNDLLPEGMQAADRDILRYQWKRKRALAHSIVGAATAGAIVVGAVPIPFADGAILGPVEVAEVNALAKIYGIGSDAQSKRFLQSIVEVGTIGAAAHTAINALKAIPFVNLGASTVNAIIAGSFVAALGEGSIYAFEQIVQGKRSTSDVEWVMSLLEEKLGSSLFLEKVQGVLQTASQREESTARRPAEDTKEVRVEYPHPTPSGRQPHEKSEAPRKPAPKNHEDSNQERKERGTVEKNRLISLAKMIAELFLREASK